MIDNCAFAQSGAGGESMVSRENYASYVGSGYQGDSAVMNANASG